MLTRRSVLKRLVGAVAAVVGAGTAAKAIAETPAADEHLLRRNCLQLNLGEMEYTHGQEAYVALEDIPKDGEGWFMVHPQWGWRVKRGRKATPPMSYHAAMKVARPGDTLVYVPEDPQVHYEIYGIEP
jgi:hypothetical protein